jgi:hypothetical protein
MPESNKYVAAVLTSVVGCGLVILGGYLYTRWDKRRYEDMTKDVHARTNAAIKRVGYILDDLL